MQLVATGGCNAAADNSGTQFVFDDENGRRIAVSDFLAYSTHTLVFWVVPKV